MRTSETGVLVLDPRGRVRSVNATAERLLGLRARLALGEPGSSFVRTAVAGDDPVRDARASARTERETVLLRPDGSGTPVLIRSWRIGRPPWVLLLLHDLGQQRRMQEELRRHERLATLGQLSARVAHGSESLAGIGTSAQVLLRR
jgi:nitrogen-specific signal transduction histidine kinase